MPRILTDKVILYPFFNNETFRLFGHNNIPTSFVECDPVFGSAKRIHRIKNEFSSGRSMETTCF